MSILTPSYGGFRESSSSFGGQFFGSPQPAGRKITAGFTYLQRIGKAASVDVWFPSSLKRQLAARRSTGQEIGMRHFPAEWAAVRQFELLQESGNHKIYDLDPSNLKRAVRDLSLSMRAGGYRITVVTLGIYEEADDRDELEILDTRLQTRIAQMIHMLYLETQSDEANVRIGEKLAAARWNYMEQLPHVGMVLGARDLYRPAEGEKRDPKKRGGKGGEQSGGFGSATDRKHRQAKQFFDIVNLLPQSHIVHDTVIGLQLPELNGVHQWNYIASPEETLESFNRVLGNIFDSCVFHLRGYGDRLTEIHDSFYRSAALALN